MGLLKLVLRLAVLLVALVVVAGGLAYATDYGVEATVKEKRCVEKEVDVQAKALPLSHTATAIPADVCAALQPGNFVVYHIRSGRTILYQSEGGLCLYDTAKSPTSCGG